jgi:hypothetical protein
MGIDIELPLHFASPVLASLMEVNQGKQHYGNSVRCEPGAPTADLERVLDYNYQSSRERSPQLSGHYQRWDDTVTVDGHTYDLHGWYEAVDGPPAAS